MEDLLLFTDNERTESLELLRRLRQLLDGALEEGDEDRITRHIQHALENNEIKRDIFGLNPVVAALHTAVIAVEEEGLRRDGVMAILLHHSVASGYESIENIERDFGSGVAKIIHGLTKIQQLYKMSPVIQSDNYRNLLLSFAEDMRVILIMIADRVNLMRQIRDTDQVEAKLQVSREASYLYAPLAHKLGLYKLKSELEDLSLKYMEHDAYYMIKDKLNATKKSRDAYVEQFIAPVEEKLKAAGVKCHIKGRTKSIHSIWQKMKKQKCGFEGIYDLFAIRIIIDAPPELEKAQCWQAFAIVTNMYQGNPKRLRDWLTVPKSNGYESLHITVLGPEQKWVEVQIRTERMDDIAERGLAAHWRYKGVKDAEGGIDDWLNSIRNALENSDDRMVMDDFRTDLYEDEVYVFTPRGELLKFPKGATILDFAYRIHSQVGNLCTGARINGKVVTFRYQLKSGDQVEVITSVTQHPKQEWLNIAKTSRAKAKIRLSLKDIQVKEAAMVKEMLERRLKNRKTDFDEAVMNHLIKKLGYKETRDFYRDIAAGTLDVNTVIEHYAAIKNPENTTAAGASTGQKAEDFVYAHPDEEMTYSSDDVIMIGQNLKGVDFQLAKCCHPIYGDKVFGFVTVQGGIKIHRTDCPNAPELMRRFGYRIVKAKWSGKGSSKYSVTLRVVGNDQIGIINNITGIISKEENITIRSISIDSNDGLFSGNIVVNVEDTARLENLIRKIKNVKGVKQVARTDTA